MASTGSSSESVAEAAMHWVVRRHSGTWTDTDEAELATWLEAATAHRIQYMRAGRFWADTARMKALGAGVPAGVIPPPGAWGDVRFLKGTAEEAVDSHVVDSSRAPYPTSDIPAAAPVRRVFVRPRFVAAAAALLIALATGSYIYTSDMLTGERYSTPIGGLDTVALDDGSQLILNTDSSVRVELRESERRIALARGEAFFEVARDPARPFIVEAGDKRVIAVGTKFSVRRDADDIQVVVTEGKVRVETQPHEEPSFRQPPVEGKILVAAGSIARTSRSAVLVRPAPMPEAEKILSWRRGYVAFDDMALADAVAEFNRYTTRKIVVEDPAIAAILVAGNFRTNNTDAFLDLLQSGFPISVEKTEDRIILRAR